MQGRERAKFDDEPHPQSDMDNVVQYVLQPVETGVSEDEEET